MEQTKKSGLARLLELASGEKSRLIVATTFATMHALLALVPYALMFYIIKELFKTNIHYDIIQHYLLLASICIIASYIFMYIAGIVSHIAAYNILYTLRKKIISKIGKLPLGYLHDATSGALKKILTDDVERIESFVAHQIPDFIKGISVPMVTIIFLFVMDWRLALVSCVPLAIVLVWIPRLYNAPQNKKLMEQYHAALEDMNSGIIEYVRAIPVMKIFGLSASQFGKYGNIAIHFYKLVDNWVRQSSPPFAIFMSFISNATLPVLALGLYLYFSNQLDLSVLILFLILGVGYIKPLFALSNIGSQLTIIHRGVEQIDKILNEPEQLTTDGFKQPTDFSIHFQNVSFGYPNTNRHAIQNINFFAGQGSITALVGHSGAGKSTVAQLIARFWDINEGTISIGGTDIRTIPIEQLMQYVSFVFQDNFMFQDTIYENIRMGMQCSEAEIVEAAKAAQIHSLINSLPNGYQTNIGENGVYLSGGEQQRIQLARAILKNAPILILDEATAFSDPENEYYIQQAFSQLIRKKTVIVIAHRLSTITDADNILVFEAGQVVAHGTHTHLLHHSDLYARMWSAHQRSQKFAINL